MLFCVFLSGPYPFPLDVRDIAVVQQDMHRTCASGKQSQLLVSSLL